MKIRELSVPDAYEIVPKIHEDSRGRFLEWYRADKLGDELGRAALDLRQANASVSRQGAVRGIHFADVPVGQAKYVTAVSGAVIDFIVDIRVGSPTFGQWDSVRLDDVERKAVFLSEGLGHAFVALTPDATVSYLVSDVYSPEREHGINPLDPEVGLVFPPEITELLVSEKDTEAPTLREAQAAGLLPDWHEVRSFYTRNDRHEAEKN